MKIDFILGDVYPIGIAQPIHSLDFFGAMSLTCLVYSISYNRAIALVDTYSEFHEKIRQFLTVLLMVCVLEVGEKLACRSWNSL